MTQQYNWLRTKPSGTPTTCATHTPPPVNIEDLQIPYKVGKFIDYLTDYWLLMTDPAPWCLLW
jgi:hypothetical protein